MFFIKFSQKRTVNAAWTSRTPPAPPLPGRWGPAAPKLAKDALAAGPLGEVLDPDLTCSFPTKLGSLYNFCFTKFSQKHTVWAARTSRTTLWPPPRRWDPAAPNLAKDALGVEPQLCAKFQRRSPGSAATYSEHTHIHTHTLPNIKKISYSQKDIFKFTRLAVAIASMVTCVCFNRDFTIEVVCWHRDLNSQLSYSCLSASSFLSLQGSASPS